jgi:hypothetical protein
MPWKSAASSKRARKSRSVRQSATQKNHGAQHQPWHEQRGGVKRSQQQPPSRTAAKAKRKGPTPSAMRAGHSTTGLFNNRYL